MAIPHDNFEDLVDHLRDARTKCIDTVEWIDNEIETESPCPVVALSQAIDKLMCEAIRVALHLRHTIPQ